MSISLFLFYPSVRKNHKKQRGKRCASEALPQVYGAEFHHGDWLRCRFFSTRSIMRDMAGKIAELKFEAPLARFEEEDTASLKNMNLLTGAREHACRLSFCSFLPDLWRILPCRTLVNLVVDQSLSRCFRIGIVSVTNAFRQLAKFWS